VGDKKQAVMGRQIKVAKAIGGCTQAVGKGWNSRVTKIIEDPRGWGRFITTEFQGGKAK
jgi:hypothetical protein